MAASNWESHFSKGTTAARPAANTLPKGAIYWSTDDHKFYVGAGVANTWADFTAVMALVSDLATYAPLASPTFTGNPVAPTQSPLNNSTRLATTAYVEAAVTAGGGGGGGTPTFVGCRVYNSAAISAANVTTTNLTFNSERFDTDAFHSTVTNTGRITVPTGKAGKYVIYGSCNWAADADGFRLLYIFLNNTTVIAATGFKASDGGNVSYAAVATEYALAVGDFVELVSFHSAGNALNVEANGNYSPEFGLSLIGA